MKKTIRIQIETNTLWVIRWRRRSWIRCQSCGPEADVSAEEPVVTADGAPIGVPRQLGTQQFRAVEAPGRAVRAWLDSLRLLVSKKKEDGHETYKVTRNR